MKSTTAACATLAAQALAGLCMAVGSAYAAVVGQEIRYTAGDATLNGYIATDDALKGKRPGILLVHDWWGPSEHVRDYARALAAKGYTALAVDMYGRSTADRKEAGELMNAVMGVPEVMKARFVAARKVLASHPTVDPGRIGAVGFSMGSTVVLNMARSGENLAGVVSVYGGLATKTPARPGEMKARVLVLHAPGDPFVKPEAIDAFRGEMQAAHVSYRFVEYPGAKHGFANPDATPSGQKNNMPIAYDAEADRKARRDILDFFAGIFPARTPK
jgi:dienelactone hydrolase